jgi:hypothetical protein
MCHFPPHPRLSRPARRWTDVAAVAAFALFLAVPLVGYLFRPAAFPANENREPWPRPPWPTERWKAKTFPPMFDAHFNDHVGFRSELLDLRRNVLLETLGDSTSDKVWIGEDGWLFVYNFGPQELARMGIDADARVRDWAAAFAERRDWLAARGMKYVVVVAPEKASVYPERLPAAVRRHPPFVGTPGLAEKFAVVDPLPSLLAAKAAGTQVYMKKDSHWTDAGAFVAYRELGRVLGYDVPGFRAKTFEQFRVVPGVYAKADLAHTLGRPPAACTEAADEYTAPGVPAGTPPAGAFQASAEQTCERLKHVESRVTESASGVGRAVLLTDSFGGSLHRLLATDFRRLAAVGTYGFPTTAIEAEKPDVVIQLMVARTMVLFPPQRIATMAP